VAFGHHQQRRQQQLPLAATEGKTKKNRERE